MKKIKPLKLKISLGVNKLSGIFYYFREEVKKRNSGREEKIHLIKTDGTIKTFRDLDAEINKGKPNKCLSRIYYKFELVIENFKYALFNFERKIWGIHNEYNNSLNQKYVLVINDITLEEFEKIEKILKNKK